MSGAVLVAGAPATSGYAGLRSSCGVHPADSSMDRWDRTLAALFRVSSLGVGDWVLAGGIRRAAEDEVYALACIIRTDENKARHIWNHW